MCVYVCVCMSQNSSPSLSLSLSLSTCIHEQCTVRGVGEFVCYTDGRVRVLFYDRTILEMSGHTCTHTHTHAHTHTCNTHRVCEFILKNGMRTSFSLPITDNSHMPLAR